MMRPFAISIFNFLCIFFSFVSFLHAQIRGDFLPIQVNYKWGVINAKGDTILNPKYDFIGFFDKFNYAPVRLNHRTGLIDQKGQILIPPEFTFVKPLHPQFILVGNDDQHKGIRNIKNKKILPLDYQNITLLESQFLKIQKTDKIGITNLVGKLILPPKFEEIRLRKVGKMVFFEVQENNFLSLFNAKGELILSSTYQKIELLSENTILAKNTNNLWEIRDAKNGKLTTEINWQNFQKANENFLVLQQEDSEIGKGKKALYSLILNKLIAKSKYDDFQFLDQFSDYALTILDQKFGLIRKNGIYLLPPKYDNFADLGNGLIAYQHLKKWGVVNTEGEILIEPTFYQIFPFPNNLPVTKVRTSRSYGLLNKLGKLLTQVKYRDVQVFADKAKCYLPKEMLLVDFDQAGNRIDSMTFRNYKTLDITGTLSGDVPRSFRDSIWSLTMGGNVARLRQVGGWQPIGNDRYIFTDTTGSPIRDKNIPFYDAYREDTIRSFSIAWRKKAKQSYIINNQGKIKNTIPIYDIHLADWWQGSYARAILDNIENPKGYIQGITRSRFGIYALVNQKGEILQTLPVKGKNFERTQRLEYQRISYIGDFSEKEGLAPVNLKGKLFFCNKNNIINLRDSVFELQNHTVFFPERPMQVSGGKWGFLTRDGKLKIQPKYDFVRDFRHGKAIVQKNGKWGVIDTRNKLIIPIEYDFIDYLPNSDEHFFILTDDAKRYGYVYENGQIFLEMDFDEVGKVSENWVRIRKAKKWGFYNLKTKQKIDLQFDRADDFHEGLAGVAILNNKNQLLWGFIDTSGNWVIEPQFSKVGYFSEGRASVRINRNYGYLNPEGQIIIKPEFRKVFPFKNGVAIVQKKYKQGIINLQGNQVLRPKYKEIFPFNEYNLAIAQKRNLRKGLINLKGEKLSKFIYVHIGEFQDSLANVKLFRRNIYKRKSGFLNTEGQEVIPTQFRNAGDFEHGLARIQLQTNGKWGFIDTEGNFKIDPKYAVASDFTNGRAFVMEKFRQKPIFITPTDKQAFSSEMYLSASKFSDNRLILRGLNNGYFIVDENGNKIHSQDFEYIKNFQNNRTFIQKNQRWGVLDVNGIQLTDFRFDETQDFENQFAKVSIKAVYGVSDENGKQILPVNFETIEKIENDLFCIRKGDRIGYLRTNGSWLWKLQK